MRVYGLEGNASLSDNADADAQANWDDRDVFKGPFQHSAKAPPSYTW
jgi:hypothetical protein